MSKMNEICAINNVRDDLSEVGGIEDKIRTENHQLTQMSRDDSAEENEWETTKYFQNSWMKFIQQHQLKMLPVKTINDHKHWFAFLPNIADPSSSTYRCRLCFKYFDKFKLEDRFRSVLANEEGIIRKAYKSNHETITEHAKSTQHHLIIQRLQKTQL